MIHRETAKLGTYSIAALLLGSGVALAQSTSAPPTDGEAHVTAKLVCGPHTWDPKRFRAFQVAALPTRLARDLAPERLVSVRVFGIA
jgi:hypothetical protein